MRVAIVILFAIIGLSRFPEGRYVATRGGHHIFIKFNSDSCYIDVVDRGVEKWQGKWVEDVGFLRLVALKRDSQFRDQFFLLTHGSYNSYVPCRLKKNGKSLTAISVYDTLGQNEILLPTSPVYSFTKIK
jgi:hypothetical protein